MQYAEVVDNEFNRKNRPFFIMRVSPKITEGPDQVFWDFQGQENPQKAQKKAQAPTQIERFTERANQKHFPG